MRELRARAPDLSVTALGGGRLRGVADEFLRDMVRMDISGFSQPFKQFFSLKSILQKMIFPRLASREFDAVILIDYYGFNIHIARKARAFGIPVFYFVSPQVWASRGWRIQELKRAVTKMLVIFPFEEELYRGHGVPAEFVGHPAVDAVERAESGRPAGAERDRPAAPGDGVLKLGILPGSRHRELARHLPIMLKALELLRKRFPKIEATVFAVDWIPDEDYLAALEGRPVRLSREQDLRERAGLDFCLTASGTAALEIALLRIPQVVIYQASWLTYWVARLLIRVDYISMPNILSGKMIVPELIQGEASPARVAEEAEKILSDPLRLESARSELIELRKSLGKPGAYSRAADVVLDSLRNPVRP
ncbi:MAG: lipid-A-disaccharide synthase [Elusimicrobia bacterium RIFCSPLOWO2_01_FULL_64_13]|nr:MAG: lipid-A-disaccharide synthase [Elusimicrobia bacterium RIFCSPLOWO2_01_FULL_64_13]